MSNELVLINLSVQTLIEFLANFSSEETKRAYASDLRNFLKSYNRNIEQITLLDLITYRDMLLKDSSPATVRRKLSTIKSFLEWCTMRGIIITNPAANLKMPKAMTKFPTLAFTDEEVSKMIAAPANEFHKAILVLLFNLGLRRSELTNMSKIDIFEDRGVNILRIRGKGSKERLVPLTPIIKESVDRYLAENVSLNPSSVYRIVNRYAKSVGITKRVGAHSCRATLISHLLENQVSPRDVADLVGHVNIQTTVGVYDKKRDMLKNSAAYKVNFRA